MRDAMKTALETIPGFRGYDTAPGSVNPPCGVVLLGDPAVVYDEVFGDSALGTGADQLRFQILVLVANTSDRTAQDNLDGYLAGSGANSVKAAVEGNLGGIVLDCSVTQAGKPGVYTYGGVEYFGSTLQVEVMV
jgi:hypothetical protein